MKALMIATKPNWVKKIIDGEKDLEFRNYAIPKGTRVLVYGSKGRRFMCSTCDGSGEVHEWLPNGINEVVCPDCVGEGYLNVGRGKVVLEFTVGKVIEFIFNEPYDENGALNWNCLYDEKMNEFKKQGYTNQKYAHTITDLIVYDDEWLIEREDYFNNASTSDGTGIVVDFNYLDKVLNAPTEPQPITNYVGWNKVHKFVERFNKQNNQRHTVNDLFTSKEPIAKRHIERCKLTHPPQGRVWIYMEED